MSLAFDAVCLVMWLLKQIHMISLCPWLLLAEREEGRRKKEREGSDGLIKGRREKNGKERGGREH